MDAKEWFNQSKYLYELDEYDEGGFLGINEEKVAEMLEEYHQFQLTKAKFKVVMHQNTIQELKEDGHCELQLKKPLYFNTIKEVVEYFYPYCRDNYIVIQTDTNIDAYLSELHGTEKNLL